MTNEEHVESHRRSEGNRLRVAELVHEVNNLSVRVHSLEDLLLPGGPLDELADAVALLAFELERIKNERQHTS